MYGLYLHYVMFTQPNPQNAITIAVSSRALFNMDREQDIYEQQGMEDYLKYQIQHEIEPFAPGPAFPFIKVKPVLLYLHTSVTRNYVINKNLKKVCNYLNLREENINFCHPVIQATEGNVIFLCCRQWRQ